MLLDAEILASLVEDIIKNSNVQGECLCHVYKDQRITHDQIRYRIPKLIWQYHFHNEIPENYRYMPVCGNRICIRPDHLHFEPIVSSSDKEEIKRFMHLRSTSTSDGLCRILECPTDRNGYGMWTVNGKRYALQRVIIWLYSDEWKSIDDLPSDKQAAHSCRNLTCINSEHYSLVTRSVNMYEHKIRDGTLPQGEKSRFAKITESTAEAIIKTWRPKGHPQFLTIQKRADLFKVSNFIVSSIDRRIRWKHLAHPNGLSPVKKKRKPVLKKVDGFGMSLTEEDLNNIHMKLKNLSEPTEEINEHTQSSCWRWKIKGVSEKPALSFKGNSNFAAIFACYVSSGDKPFEDAQAAHQCGQSWCVNPEHISWLSAKENAADKRKHGTSGHKLTIDLAREIRSSNEETKILAARYKVSDSLISQIRKGRIWRE